MGVCLSKYHAVTIMQSLILLCLATYASATLVYYHNGAVAPLDPNVEAAKADHFKALAYAGPAYGAAAVGVSHPFYAAPIAHHYIGKREADADAYYGYAGYGYGHLGYAGYGHLGYAGHLGYGGYYGLHAAGLPASAAGLVTYANGATVPVEPLANQVARAQHLHAKFGRKKREADAFYGFPGYGYGYGLGYAGHIGYPVVAPFVAHPASGAIVPLESAAIVEARHAHLAEVAKQIANGGVPEVPAAEE